MNLLNKNIMKMKKYEIDFILENNKKESFLVIPEKDGVIIKNKKQQRHFNYIYKNNKLSIHTTNNKLDKSDKNKHKNIKESEELNSILLKLIKQLTDNSLKEYYKKDLFILDMNIQEIFEYLFFNNTQIHINIKNKKIKFTIYLYNNLKEIEKNVINLIKNKKSINIFELESNKKNNIFLLNSKDELLLYKNKKVYLANVYLDNLKKENSIFNDIIFKQSKLLIENLEDINLFEVIY